MFLLDILIGLNEVLLTLGVFFGESLVSRIDVLVS